MTPALFTSAPTVRPAAAAVTAAGDVTEKTFQ
jgi:hypothetical protein